MILDWVGEVGWEINFTDAKKQIDEAMVKQEPIEINLYTFGGSYYDGIAIYDYIKDKDVSINIHGIAASAGTIIASGAAKGKLAIHENAEFMIHQARTGVMGFLTSDDFEDEADNLSKANERLISIYSKRTGINPDEIKEMLMNEKTFSAKEALELGFVDSIIATADVEDTVTNRLRNMVVNAKSNYSKRQTKKDDDSIDKMDRITTKKPNEKTTIINNNGDSKVDAQGQTQLPITDNSAEERIKEKDALIAKLQSELTNNKQNAMLAEKDAKIADMQKKIDEFDKREQDRVNAIVSKINEKSIANIEKSGIELKDEIKSIINGCKDATICNAINDITNMYSDIIANMKPSGTTDLPASNEKFDNSQTDKRINVNDTVAIEAIVNKLIADDAAGKFNGDTLRAYEYMVTNNMITEE